MRGEERQAQRDGSVVEELPPHARRRVCAGGGYDNRTGITSACAEKSICDQLKLTMNWNYLRMRGEENPQMGSSIAPEELPPHARRRVTGGADAPGGWELPPHARRRVQEK